MIELARRYEGIEFYVLRAEEMDFREEFDVIFCNSAFQWFKPDEVLPRCYRALRKNGRIGVQAPAKREYCPIFVRAFERVQREIEAFRSFSSPWFFLETEGSIEICSNVTDSKSIFARWRGSKLVTLPRRPSRSS